jgi:hypothetical protein
MWQGYYGDILSKWAIFKSFGSLGGQSTCIDSLSDYPKKVW